MCLRRLATLGLVLLALGGCKSRAWGKCDREATTALAAKLDASEPEAQPELLTNELASACKLPEFFSHWIALMNSERGLGFLGDAALDYEREVLAKLCPAAAETPSPIADAPWEQRAAKLYDTCELGRLGVVSRDDYIRYQRPGMATWAGYQWLRTQGVTPEAATSITRALLVLERRGDAMLSFRVDELRPPKLEGATLPRAGFETVINLGTEELVFNGESLAQLDAGRFEPRVVQGHVIMPLYDKLTEELDKRRAVDEARGLPTEPYVLLAIDGRVPFVSMQDLEYTAGRAQVARLGLIAEVGPWIYEPLPLEFPRYQTSPDGPDDGALALMVTIDAEGFAVRDQADDRAKLEHIGPDPAALATRAEEHLAAHPKARLAAISPDEDVEVETIARAIAALRGPKCRTHVANPKDCRLPRVVLLAAGMRGYHPRPPPEERPSSPR